MGSKTIYMASSGFESDIMYFFSTRKAAKTFMDRYDPRPNRGWNRIHSYTLDPKRLKKFDLMWFSNTPEGKDLLETEKKNHAEWRAEAARKTPLDNLMERLDAHISVNSHNAKMDIKVLREYKKLIKELVEKSPGDKR